jgi:hypothetical protein
MELFDQTFEFIIWLCRLVKNQKWLEITFNNMPVPVMQIVGLSVFTACAIIAAGLLFLERPMDQEYRYQYQPTEKPKEEKQSDKEMGMVFELMSMGFDYNKIVSIIRSCSTIQEAIEALLQEDEEKQASAQKKQEEIAQNQPLSAENRSTDVNDQDWITKQKLLLQQRLSLLEEYETKSQLLQEVNSRSDIKVDYVDTIQRDVKDIERLLRNDLTFQDGSSVYGSVIEDSRYENELVGESVMDSCGSPAPDPTEEVKDPSVSLLAIPLIPTVASRGVVSEDALTISSYPSNESQCTHEMVECSEQIIFEAESATVSSHDEVLHGIPIDQPTVSRVESDLHDSASEWDLASM